LAASYSHRGVRFQVDRPYLPASPLCDGLGESSLKGVTAVMFVTLFN
jgi:hypothetical protein